MITLLFKKYVYCVDLIQFYIIYVYVNSLNIYPSVYGARFNVFYAGVLLIGLVVV